MALEINFYSDNEFDSWTNYINNSTSSTIYHTLEWKKILEDTFNYRPYYLVAYDEEDIKGVLPLFEVKTFFKRKLISLPFSYLGGPVAENSAISGSLIKTGLNLINSSHYDSFEIRSQGNIDLLIKNNYYKDLVLDLSHNIVDVEKNIHKSIRRYFKNKNKVKIREATTLNDLKSFYELYLGMRKKHGVPPQRFAFFKSMFEILRPKNLIQILICSKSDKDIGAIILLLFKDKIIYAYGATDEKYKDYHPNILLLWEGIKYGCMNDFKSFYFGRTSKDQAGLMNFKKKWGSREVDLSYYFHPSMPNIASMDRASYKYQLLTGLWKKFPIKITEILGNVMIKNYP